MLCIVGGAVERSETDDQQDVGSACERQDGKRVVGGLILPKTITTNNEAKPQKNAIIKKIML